MDTRDNLISIDVVILCGGLGTRLRGLFPNQPKSLVRFGERIFIDILIEQLKSAGFRRFIFCVGYLRDKIEEHCKKYQDIDVIFSEEELPLGTGGAVKNAQKHIKSNPFLILNGDSLCRVDFNDLYEFHINKEALLTIVLSSPGDREDGGNVLMSKAQKILKFSEKSHKSQGSFINSGIYCMDQRIFNYMPNLPAFSLEIDIFPRLLHKRCFGFLSNSDVIDIGTVDRYNQALGYIENF